MKHKKPKINQYRFKRGFFLFPKWEIIEESEDHFAKAHALDQLDFDNYCSIFNYRKLKLQKQVDGRWINLEG